MKKVINIIVTFIFFAALLASVTSNNSKNNEISTISPSIPIPVSSSSDLAVDQKSEKELAAVELEND